MSLSYNIPKDKKLPVADQSKQDTNKGDQVQNEKPKTAAVAMVDPDWGASDDDHSNQDENASTSDLSSKKSIFANIKSKFEALKSQVLEENKNIAQQNPLDERFVDVCPPDWGMSGLRSNSTSPPPSTVAELKSVDSNGKKPGSLVASKIQQNNTKQSTPGDSEEEEDLSSYLDSSDDDEDDTKSKSKKKSVYQSQTPLSYDLPKQDMNDKTVIGDEDTMRDQENNTNTSGFDMDRDWEKFFEKDTKQSTDMLTKSGENIEDVLASRLLSRWTLMANHCIQCQSTPLVSRDGVIECIKCEINFSMNDEGVLMPQESKSSLQYNEATIPDLADSKNADVDLDDMDPVDRYFLEQSITVERETKESRLYSDSIEKKRQSTSQILGERMLSGWIMLGDICSGPTCATPLLKEKKTGKIECVSCNTVYQVGDSESMVDDVLTAQKQSDKNETTITDIPNSESYKFTHSDNEDETYDYGHMIDGPTEEEIAAFESELSLEETRALLESSELDEQMKRNRRASAKIAQYLSSGYGLSDLHCSECLAPLLVSSEDKKLVCAVCGSRFMSEEKYTQKLEMEKNNLFLESHRSSSRQANDSSEDRAAKIQKQTDEKSEKNAPQSGYVSLADLRSSANGINKSTLINVPASESSSRDKELKKKTVTKTQTLVSQNKQDSTTKAIDDIELKLLSMAQSLAVADDDDIITAANKLKAVADALTSLKQATGWNSSN